METSRPIISTEAGTTQEVHLLEKEEERSEHGCHPSNNNNDANNLAGKELAIAAIEQTVVRVGAVSLGHVVGGCHEANIQDAPGTAESMHRACLQGIVNLHLDKQGAGSNKDEGANEAANEGSPGLNDRAGGSDRHKPGEKTVAHIHQVPLSSHVIPVEHKWIAIMGVKTFP